VTATAVQIAALAFGVVYLLAGLVGWAVTDDFTGVDDDADLLATGAVALYFGLPARRSPTL
jgi:hypothetical protein